MLALLGVVIWVSNDDAGSPGTEDLREACAALARYHAESGSCPGSVEALRLPSHDGSGARQGLAYAADGDSCRIAITEGELVGESCTVP